VLIDWFTVAAQVINFLVLVALLKHFLYRPILAAMDAREARIAAQVADAENKQKSAEAERAAILSAQQALETRRRELLAQADKEAAAHRQELTQKLRQEIEELRAGWLKSLSQERDLFFQDVRRRLIQQVAAVSRRALHDLAGMDLEQRLLEVFLERVKDMDSPTRAEFVEAVQEAQGQVTITSGFALPSEVGARLLQALETVGGQMLKPQFGTGPETFFGIEVKAGGCKIAWSLENYLQDLEETLAAAFDETDGRRLP